MINDDEDSRTFYANAYFDDVIGFIKASVPTSQDKYKPSSCNEYGKEFYESRTKSNKSDFVAIINSHLIQIPRKLWPYKNDLFIQISISDSKSKIKQIDIDNLIKTVFDSIKGVIFNDDSQVVSVYADKFYFDEVILPSFVFGIRELQPKETPIFQEFMWSGNKEYTKLERENRDKLKRPTCFHVFDLSPNTQGVPDHILKKSGLL